MNTPIKSLGKFTPQVDPTLRARLTGSKAEPVKADTAITTTALAEAQPQAPNVGNSETRQLGPPVTIKVELYLELIDDPQKCCPAYAYVGRDDPPDTQRIVVVLNRSLWPAAAALARGDQNALRWLATLAVLDRCLTWPSHPVLYAVSVYLAQAGLGASAQGCQRGLWAAYALRNHPLFAIDNASIQKGKSEHSPQKFAEFDVEVDSVRLASWRAKFAAKHKRSTPYVS